MADGIKQSVQSSGAARKVSERPPDLSEASSFEATPQGAPRSADTPDLDILKSEYERTDQQLKAWLWVGVALLLLGFGLWRWGPREQLTETVPVAVRGYALRQAGSVRGPGGTTWLWMLADTAGQAQVLLSADHGRPWRARPLALPSYRARALALGWGALGKGLVVGDSGWVRTLADVLNSPTQGQNYQLAGSSSAALRSVAVDTVGQEAVVTGTDGQVWATLDRGDTWTLKELSASRIADPYTGIVAAYWAHRGSFLLASPWRIGEIRPASKAKVTDMSSWAGWTNEKPQETLVALAFDLNQERDNILFTTRYGQAYSTLRFFNNLTDSYLQPFSRRKHLLLAV